MYSWLGVCVKVSPFVFAGPKDSRSLLSAWNQRVHVYHLTALIEQLAQYLLNTSLDLKHVFFM